MAKVTSKLQITIPKALAQQVEIREGDEIEWSASGGSLRVRRRSPKQTAADRLKMFDAVTRRLRRRKKPPRGQTRGWLREELYDRRSR